MIPVVSKVLLASVVVLSCSGCDKPPPGETALAASASVMPASAPLDLCAADDFDAILQKYVRADGRFDYAGLKTSAPDSEKLGRYLDKIAKCDSDGLSAKANQAFWINAYNAFNLKGVLDHYPIKDIKSVPGFLDKVKYRVAGRDLTLNDMEYKQIIPVHKDGRAHFAVVCADNGSVPLESHAYSAANLDDTLEKKAKQFASDPHNFRVDKLAKTVFVSMLFSPEWYEKDYAADPRFKGKRAIEYLAPYVDPATADFLRKGDYKISYIDWNWSLNQPEGK